jgi:hypothetical protein
MAEQQEHETVKLSEGNFEKNDALPFHAIAEDLSKVECAHMHSLPIVFATTGEYLTRKDSQQ